MEDKSKIVFDMHLYAKATHRETRNIPLWAQNSHGRTVEDLEAMGRVIYPEWTTPKGQGAKVLSHG